MIEECGSQGIAYLMYSPLGGSRPNGSLAQSFPEVTQELASIGLSTAQLVLIWELGLSPTVIPVVGTSRESTLRNSLAASGTEIPADILGRFAADVTALRESTPSTNRS